MCETDGREKEGKVRKREEREKERERERDRERDDIIKSIYLDNKYAVKTD